MEKVIQKINEKFGNDYTLKITDIFGNEKPTKDSSIVFNFQFNDCLQKNSSICGGCEQSRIINNFKENIYSFLEDLGMEYIQVNKYEKGTNITFVKPLYPMPKGSLEITTPGVDSIVITEGNEYYVGFEKYDMEKNDYKKKKLLKIERLPYIGYKLKFEGIEDCLFVITRGHCEEKKIVINRIDHGLLSNYKKTFIKGMIQLLAKNIGLYNQEYDKKYIKEIKKAIGKF